MVQVHVWKQLRDKSLKQQRKQRYIANRCMTSNRCLVYLQPTVLQKGRLLLLRFFVWHKENSQLMLNMCNIKNIMRMTANSVSTAELTASLLCQNQQSWPQGSAVVYLILRINLWVINLSAVHNSWQLLFSANTLYFFFLVIEHFFLLNIKAPSVSES